MLTIDEFVVALPTAIPRFAGYPPNPPQENCIRLAIATPLMIVAGPGSGKTTVLVLRALRHVFVDGLLPEQVIITTFTKKAAAEIRTRLLEWGSALHAHTKTTKPALRTKLDLVDINRFVTGTLDSLCEDVVTTQRDPGDPVPVLAEGFVANAWLLRKAIYPAKAYQNTDVDTYLSSFTFEGEPPANAGELTAVVRTLVDRFVHDRVDLAAYRKAKPKAAREIVATVAETYEQFLQERFRLDFARLEQRFCERVRNGGYQRFVSNVRAVLVDEYQDTNPLQEEIYFQLILKTSASFTVVGDDDQSLYRFRGATVELFRDFIKRFNKACPKLPKPTRIDLVDNYRSTPEIVGFFNGFIANDADFKPARVQPLKPLIIAKLPSRGVPVLGLFRPTREELAAELGRFLLDVFRNGGRVVNGPKGPVTIVANPAGGNFGDAVYLGHTVSEYGSRWGTNPPTERLPKLLRDELEAKNVRVFNPRGRALRDIEVVQQLLGLMLECIDPPQKGQMRGRIEENARLRGDMIDYFALWRAAALKFIATNPAPTKPHTLKDFVHSWQIRKPHPPMTKWPEEWPLLELLFKLLSWFPAFRVDPEGQVYLEAISRGIAAASTFSAYRSLIRHGTSPHDDRSVMSSSVPLLPEMR
jgi:DNA helicase-2/ATP-dependent DNA helicase PcrA